MIARKPILAVAFCGWVAASQAMARVPPPPGDDPAASEFESDNDEDMDAMAPAGREERKTEAAGAGREERKTEAAGAGREERKTEAAGAGREERKTEAVAPDAEAPFELIPASVEKGKFDPAKAAGLKRILQKLYKPRYGWTYGLASGWRDSPKTAALPMTYALNRAMNPDDWIKADTPAMPDATQSLFIYSSKVDAWLKKELDITLPHPSPSVILTPLVAVTSGQKVHFNVCPAVDTFILHAVLEGRRVCFYMPVNARALTQGDPGHYILAVVKLEPGVERRTYDLHVDFYDSLMSGRTELFRRDEEQEFTTALHTYLAGVAAGHVKVILHLRSKDHYHEVSSQGPWSTNCGRFVVLYTFAHMMGIPYKEWYRERFNLVLPDYVRVFDGGK